MTDDQFKAYMESRERQNEIWQSIADNLSVIARVLTTGAEHAAKEPPSPAQRPVAPSGR